MSYEVVFLETFLKQFKRLPKDVRERVRRRVMELATDPYLGLKLKGQLEGFWKDRVGDYRLIYKVEDSARMVVFYDVDLCKRVYD